MKYFSQPPNREFYFGAAVGATTAVTTIFLFTAASLFSFGDTIDSCLKDANRISIEAQRLQAVNNCYITYPNF